MHRTLGFYAWYDVPPTAGETGLPTVGNRSLSVNQNRFRRLLAWTLALPLLQTAGCVDIAVRSTINGFFDFLNPLVQEQACEAFDVQSPPCGQVP
jgi:hypothetical protein